MKNCILLLVFLSGIAHLHGKIIKQFTCSPYDKDKECKEGHVRNGDKVLLKCQVQCSQITQDTYIEFRKWSETDNKFVFMGRDDIDPETCISKLEVSATTELSGLQLKACFLGNGEEPEKCIENVNFPSVEDTCQENIKSDNNNHLGLAIGISVSILILLALTILVWRKYKQPSAIKISKDDQQGAKIFEKAAKRSLRGTNYAFSRCNLF